VRHFWKFVHNGLVHGLLMPPDSLELSVYQSSISVSETGSRQRAFERDTHSDNTDDLAFVPTKRIHPNSEAL
jgi:hypothetical protein